MFCTKCGQASQAGAKFCTSCGATFNVTTATPGSHTKPDPVATPSNDKNKIDVAPAVAPEVAVPKVTPEVITPKAVTSETKASETVAPKAATPEAPIYSDLSSLNEEQNGNSKKTLLLIVVAVIIIALLAGGAWLYKRQQATTTSADQAVASMSDNAEPASAPTVANKLPAEPTPSATAEAATPVAPAVDSMKASTPAVPIKPAATQAPSVTLSKTETNNLVARLQREAIPASCKSGEAKVRKESNVSVKQARAIAKRAYPQLCDSTATKNTPAKSMPVESAPVKVENKTVTQIYKERSKAECDSGIAGFICREALRVKVCDGKWSSNPPSGQSVCFRQDN